MSNSIGGVICGPAIGCRPTDRRELLTRIARLVQPLLAPPAAQTDLRAHSTCCHLDPVEDWKDLRPAGNWELPHSYQLEPVLWYQLESVHWLSPHVLRPARMEAGLQETAWVLLH